MAGRAEDIAEQVHRQADALTEMQGGFKAWPAATARFSTKPGRRKQIIRTSHQRMTQAQAAIKVALDDVLSLTDGIARIEQRLPGLEQSWTKLPASPPISSGSPARPIFLPSMRPSRLPAPEKPGAASPSSLKSKTCRGRRPRRLRIQQTLAALTGQIRDLIAESGEASNKASAAPGGSGQIGDAVRDIDHACTTIAATQRTVSAIAAHSRDNQAACDGLVGGITRLSETGDRMLASPMSPRARIMS